MVANKAVTRDQQRPQRNSRRGLQEIHGRPAVCSGRERRRIVASACHAWRPCPVALRACPGKCILDGLSHQENQTPMEPPPKPRSAPCAGRRKRARQDVQAEAANRRVRSKSAPSIRMSEGRRHGRTSKANRVVQEPKADDRSPTRACSTRTRRRHKSVCRPRSRRWPPEAFSWWDVKGSQCEPFFHWAGRTWFTRLSSEGLNTRRLG